MIRATAASATLALTLLAAAAQAAPGASTTDFSSGANGWTGVVSWDGTAGSWVDDTLGNAAPAYHTVIQDTFGLHWTNNSNPAVIGDYTQASSVTFSLDFNAYSITYLGNEVARNLVVELRDYDNAPADLPYTSVWYVLGSVQAGEGWTHLSVTIDDTSSLGLPAGWGGYGAEDADGAPILPANRSFSDVLRSVDEVVFTTFVPGYFYGWTNYDVAVDNISITAVPEPGTLLLQALGLATLAGLARRRSRQTRR
ncbi:MAG: PEP-CTERM sorting domain-containing protein [Roseateles depolymerans]|uniref:PEP-CTERM sorting domain-containing protein n=1 Tax=Roseateles depolymerans TaxID=76731 RepID=A0A2W5DR30_9BURK|nr:MAG: PEP-CTERM sorting domain-containing protein [Roseateles depolymerans]